MTDDLLKNLIKTKLSLIDSSLSLLPDNTKYHIESLKQSLVKALNEATGEYLQTHNEEGKKDDKALKKVSIE